jgi:hypothetical protein
VRGEDASGSHNEDACVRSGKALATTALILQIARTMTRAALEARSILIVNCMPVHIPQSRDFLSQRVLLITDFRASVEDNSLD